MTEQRPSKDQLSEAAEIASSFNKYAYDQGMHEVGFDPVKVLTDEIERLNDDLAWIRRRTGFTGEVPPRASQPPGDSWDANGSPVERS